jgi:hypothetical protein
MGIATCPATESNKQHWSNLVNDANPTVNGRPRAHDPSQWLGRTHPAGFLTVRYWCTRGESESSRVVAMISASQPRPLFLTSLQNLVTLPVQFVSLPYQ